MIRQATKADIPEVARIGRQFADYYPYKAQYDEERVADSLSAIINMGVILVMIKEEAIIGFIMGVLVPLWYAPTTITAQELAWWMDPEHRKGMAGLKLLTAFEEWAKASGANLIMISDLLIEGEYPIGKILTLKGYQHTERLHMKEV